MKEEGDEYKTTDSPSTIGNVDEKNLIPYFLNDHKALASNFEAWKTTFCQVNGNKTPPYLLNQIHLQQVRAIEGIESEDAKQYAKLIQKCFEANDSGSAVQASNKDELTQMNTEFDGNTASENQSKLFTMPN